MHLNHLPFRIETTSLILWNALPVSAGSAQKNETRPGFDNRTALE
jgi:hypothetical protein